jgi:hypothetical protein
MRPSTADAIIAATACALATGAFVLWREGVPPWGGTWAGHVVGIVGTLLMLWAGFGYTRRKQRPAPGAAAMREAMGTHVVAGLAGPYLVILHSGLAIHGLAGALVVLVLVVVASGLIGRVLLAAMPRTVLAADPVKVALLDAETARVERRLADLSRQPEVDEERREALRLELVALEHQEEWLRAQWGQRGGGALGRRVLSVWWLLHVPASMALWVVAAAHVAATLYYATLSR